MHVICSIMRPYPMRPKSPPVYINHIENFLQIVSNETLTVCALHRILPSCSNNFFFLSDIPYNSLISINWKCEIILPIVHNLCTMGSSFLSIQLFYLYIYIYIYIYIHKKESMIDLSWLCKMTGETIKMKKR